MTLYGGLAGILGTLPKSALYWLNHRPGSSKELNKTSSGHDIFCISVLESPKIWGQKICSETHEIVLSPLQKSVKTWG